MDLVALSNGLHGSVQMDSVALFSWIGWLRHHGIFNVIHNSLTQKKKDTITVFLLRYYLCFEQIATPTPIVAIQITENHPV